MQRLQDAKLLISGALREASIKAIFADISFGGFAQSGLMECRVPRAKEVSQGQDERRAAMSGARLDNPQHTGHCHGILGPGEY